MSNPAVKAVILLVYLALLSLIMGFDFLRIVNLPFLVMVSSGGLLLALLGYRKGSGKWGYLQKLKIMLLFSGGLTAFLANIAFLSAGTPDGAELYAGAVQNFLPLFYGFLFYFILDLIRVPQDGPEDGAPPPGGGAENLEDYDLTRRELAVAREILLDLSNGEIAAKLYITENTVKKHVNHIFQKVGARNRTAFIVRFAPKPESKA
ncbi:helix-turn-helix domain-containing protein [Sporobacter termitidis]|nr:helix-turn-helix transcriptional regulator [Sporobacter termitidis]